MANLFIAALAGVVGTYFGQRGVSYMLPLFAALPPIKNCEW